MEKTGKPGITAFQSLGEMGLHGLNILSSGGSRGYAIRIGTYEDPSVKSLVDSGEIKLDLVPEAYAFGKTGTGYVLAGFDEKGLMYGCQELSDRLSDGADISSLGFSDKPYTKTRGIYGFLHNEDLEEEWFYNPSYWVKYFDVLAENRFNSFNLVFSHQTSYLVPMFAYFLDASEFPRIHPEDAGPIQIRRNGDMLRFISEQSAKRGIDFILGIWQVSPWKNRQGCRVTGLNPENLREYTYRSMKRIIREFPAVKGLQIRANWESGIAPEEQTEFFTNTLFKAMAEAERPFIFDFRCWLAEPKTVENALNMVPGTRLSCKYWAEFLGAPYQPAKIVPGYSYSDFLKHPMRTDLIYQLWNLGSPRLLLWGDPEYVRRFVHSLKLGGGAGFEMNTHLAQKGYGNDAGYWRVFRHEEDEYFTYEYERYWMTGLLFGRLSYNPDSPRDIWMRALRLRFGAAAEEVMNLYEAGSGIITFLIQYQLSDYNMYIWPEIDTGGLLDFYMQTPGSDKCVVDIVENYVDGITKDDPSGLFSPLESSEHFRLMAEKTLLAAAGLEKLPNPSKELASTIKDFKILSFLGLYHSVKTLAAVSLKYYYAAGDITCLRDAYEKIRKATVYWEQLISLGRDYYYDKMVTGPNDAGSWRTKLELVYEDEIRVAELIRVAERYGGSCFAVDFGPVSDKPSPFRTWLNFDILHSYVVEKGFSQADAGTVYSAERGYGWESGTIHDVSMPLVRLNDLEFDAYRRDTWDSAPVEQCKGLRSALNEDGVWGTSPAVFRCDLENGEYEVSVIIADQTEHTRIHGPMTLEAGDIKISEFMAMPVDETIKTVRVKITEGFLRINIACVSGGDWFLSGIAVKPLAPLIRVVPVVVLTREHPVVSATIHSPEGIQKAELSIDGGTPVPLKLRQGCEYSADLGDLPPFGKKIRTPCIITAESSGGKRSRRESILLLRDKASEIRVTHTPVNTGKAGKDIPIKAIISSAYPLRKALLHYSYVNQFEEIHTVDLKAAKNEYTAIIPGTYIDPQWDLLYYFELVDELGSGIIYPDMRTRTPYWVIEPLR